MKIGFDYFDKKAKKIATLLEKKGSLFLIKYKDGTANEISENNLTELFKLKAVEEEDTIDFEDLIVLKGGFTVNAISLNNELIVEYNCPAIEKFVNEFFCFSAVIKLNVVDNSNLNSLSREEAYLDFLTTTPHVLEKNFKKCREEAKQIIAEYIKIVNDKICNFIFYIENGDIKFLVSKLTKEKLFKTLEKESISLKEKLKELEFNFFKNGDIKKNEFFIDSIVFTKEDHFILKLRYLQTFLNKNTNSYE